MSDRYRRVHRGWKSVGCAAALLLCVPLRADAQLSEILDIVQNIQSRVSTASSQAQAARLAAEEVRTQVRQGVNTLTPQLRQFIDQAVADARTILEDEAEGLEAFAPGGQCGPDCEAFRTELVGALTGSVGLTAAILESTGSSSLPDLPQAIAIAQAAPPRLLYPLFRMLEGTLGAGLAERLSFVSSETRAVVPMTVQTSAGSCTTVVENLDRIQRWTTAATGVSVVLQVIGGLARFLGETEFAGEAGIAGFVSGTIKSNKRKQFGEIVTVAGTIVDKASTFASTKVRFCLIYAFQDETRATLAALQTTMSGLNLDLTNLDQPISSRATQGSVDEVRSTLDGVARNVTLLLDQHGGGPGQPGGSFTLRVQIEHQMRSGEGPLSVFYLPESFGGLLELVRHVVEDSLVQHAAAGYPVGPAWQFLSMGDQARTALDYRTAYGWYQHAYRMATNDHPDKKGGH